MDSYGCSADDGVSLLAAACGESGGIGGGNGDSYQDYNPDKESGGGQFDFDGNYAAPELVIDGKGDDEAWKTRKFWLLSATVERLP